MTDRLFHTDLWGSRESKYKWLNCYSILRATGKVEKAQYDE